jgi:hypothetical protein
MKTGKIILACLLFGLTINSYAQESKKEEEDSKKKSNHSKSSPKKKKGSNQSSGEGIKGDLYLKLGINAGSVHPNMNLTYDNYGWYAWNGAAYSYSTTLSDKVSKIMVGLGAGVDYGLTEDISIGGYTGMDFGGSTLSGVQEYSYLNGVWYNRLQNVDFKMSYMHFYFAPRAQWHFKRLFHMPEKMDWYAGIAAGFNLISGKIKAVETEIDGSETAFPMNARVYHKGTAKTDEKYHYMSALVNIHTGFSYSFTDMVGLYAEMGGGLNCNYIQLGVNLKLK